VAVHLLLRDVLGEPVGAPGAARAARHLPRRAAEALGDVELGVLHVGDEPPARREARVERRRARPDRDLAAPVLVEVDDVEPSADGHEQAPPRLGPLVRRHAETALAEPLAPQRLVARRRLVAHAVARGVEEHAARTCRHLDRDERLRQRAVGTREAGDERAVGREPDRRGRRRARTRVAGDVEGGQRTGHGAGEYGATPDATTFGAAP
jgi:hypothetical protein